MPKKFRGKGPRIFISYSFGSSVAARVRDQLLVEGFQVTFVDDVSLLGSPSLRDALDGLVKNCEYVVPVLDTRANESEWVRSELLSAKRHRVPILPVVVDETNLPELVKDIPYLTPKNVNALIQKVLHDYALIPIDLVAPIRFSSDALQDYMKRSRPYKRVLIDTDDVIGFLEDKLEATVELAVKKQPKLKTPIHKQVARHLQRLRTKIEVLEEVIPLYREALNHTLQAYAAQTSSRSLPSWHALAGLLIGIELIHIAETLSPTQFPSFWEPVTDGILRAFEAYNRHTQASELEFQRVWALEQHMTHPPRDWSLVEFETFSGRNPRVLIPHAQGVQMGIRLREPPSRYLENHQWADYCLPQIFAEAIGLRERSGNRKYTEAVSWNVSDYVSSQLV